MVTRSPEVTRSTCLCPKGPEPDRGPQAEGPAGCSQDRPSVVHQSEEDEGHLPHPQPLQHRRDAEVSDRRGVVSRLRSGLHPVRSASGDGESPASERQPLPRVSS